MCEVLKSNFEEIYPEIEDSIKRSSFIAIDLEFTGLHFEDGCNNNMFDDGAERYSKLKKNCQNFTISQIGLAVFRHDTTNSCYTANVFNVFVFPQSCASLDERFSCQASSLKFLCQYEFDFNKFIYDGVPFLTHEQEEKLRALGNPEELLSTIGGNFFRPIFTSVSVWLRQAAVDDEMVIDANRGVDILILQAKLCTMFKEIWTRSTSKNEVIVMKVSVEKRKVLENTSPAWKSRIIDSLVGFSKVFRLICDSKKPVVGHNMLMDLLLMYDKFHNKLPSSWTDFKNELHRIIPNIYDTKHLASKCRKILKGYNLATQTNITDLYELLQSEKGQLAAFNPPTISLDPKSKHYGEEKHYHEAGYDAYICGYGMVPGFA
ncbi:poly(A)-specific ribonuclease PNLDC1-like [Anneissia japonica]|uniref:poly(A)-specific ribonuclease PNLDC1-like n=1 Tax=Anneissia japonica TaxID=1529436 RepID=UPI0014258522|nr:poly(A)-specific ribonuclease PNLDC1-like [Anneissia japonica]